MEKDKRVYRCTEDCGGDTCYVMVDLKDGFHRDIVSPTACIYDGDDCDAKWEEVNGE